MIKKVFILNFEFCFSMCKFKYGESFIRGLYSAIFQMLFISCFYSFLFVSLLIIFFDYIHFLNFFSFFVCVFFLGFVVFFFFCKRPRRTKKERRLNRKRRKKRRKKRNLSNLPDNFLTYWLKFPFYFLYDSIIHIILCTSTLQIPLLIIIDRYWKPILLFLVVFFSIYVVYKAIQIYKILYPPIDHFFELVIKLEMMKILMKTDSPIDTLEFLDILQNNFDDTEICFYLSCYYEKIILQNSEILDLVELGDGTSYVSSINFIQVFIRNPLIVNSNLSDPFYVHPSIKIEDLLEIIFKNFGKNFRDIKLGDVSLLKKDYHKNSLLELGFQNDCEIQLIPSDCDLTSSYGGGAGDLEDEQEVQIPVCKNCETIIPDFRNLCHEHQNCSPCRRLPSSPCECCPHNRIGKRCPHGWCYKSCIFVKNRKNTCECHLIKKNENKRDRDYNLRSKKNTPPIDPPNLNYTIPSHCEFSQPLFPSYPINIYGDRNSFSFLTDYQWLSYQCLLFFNSCEEQNVKPQTSTTWTFFIKNYGQDTKFSIGDVEKILMLYITNQISIENFRFDSRNSLNNLTKNHSKNDSFTELVNSIILLYHQYPELNLVEFFEKILDGMEKQNPGLISNSRLSPGKLSMSVGCLESISEFIKILNQQYSGTRYRSNLIHISLQQILFKNDFVKNDKDIQNFLEVSDYHIKQAKKNIEEFQNGNTNSFERNFKTKEIYDLETDILARSYWDIGTIPCDGKKTSSNGKNSEKIPIRYLPMSVQDFYLRFADNENFGQKCKTIKGQLRVPSLWWFNQRRPKHIRPMRKFRTGYCGICMEAQAKLETFKKMMKTNCTCKSLECKNFRHESECDRFLDSKGNCQQCSECCCDQCSTCIVDKITSSIFVFMKFVKCNSEKHGGFDFPNLECIHHEKTCEKCDIQIFADLVQRFGCCTILKNINLKDSITTKTWGKKEISTPFTKKKKFEIHIMEPVQTDQETFIKDFIKFFFTQKRNFCWHFSLYHYQNFIHQEMIAKFMKGIFGEKVGMMITDWCENYNMKGGAIIASKQHYAYEPCQILGIIDLGFFKNNFQCISNFILSDIHVSEKNCQTGLSEIQNVIEERMQTENIETFHIWSDGSCAEFFQCNVFGNMGKISKHLGIKIIWHYFINNHGKNWCDSEFSRYKTKLDYLILSSTIECYRSIEHLHECCCAFLSKSAWKMKGKITDRHYVHRKENLSWSKLNTNLKFETFTTCTDSKLYRCVGFDTNGKFYRRENSCYCKHCTINPSFLDNETCKISTLSGDWKEYVPKRECDVKRRKKKSKKKVKKKTKKKVKKKTKIQKNKKSKKNIFSPITPSYDSDLECVMPS